MVKVGMGNGTAVAVGDVFAEPPDEPRDLPETDRTCTLTAWTVNKDNEIISPVATLKVRPVDTDQGAVTGFRDCQPASAVALTDLVSTACTVLKQARGRPGSRQPQQGMDGHPQWVAVRLSGAAAPGPNRHRHRPGPSGDRLPDGLRGTGNRHGTQPDQSEPCPDPGSTNTGTAATEILRVTACCG